MSSPAAWHNDPTGKHDHRWWDGTKWTEHVADPQPSQPSWQQPGGAGPDATAQQPSWQQPQQGHGGDPYAQQPAWDNSAVYTQNTGGTDGVAVAALVVGILSLLTSWFVLGGLGGIIALVLGLVALGRIKRNRSGGRGMAITGVVTGILSILVAIVVVIIGVSIFGDAAADYERCLQENSREVCDQQLEQGILDRFR